MKRVKPKYSLSKKSKLGLWLSGLGIIFGICGMSINLWQCNLEKDKYELLKDFSMKEYIDSYFAFHQSEFSQFDTCFEIKEQEVLRMLYQKNHNNSFWFSENNQANVRSEQLLQTLANSMNYGLDTTLYNLPFVKNFTQYFSQDTLITEQNKKAMLGYELHLTQATVLFFKYLHSGIMPFNPSEYITDRDFDSTSSYLEIYNYFNNISNYKIVDILYHAFKTDNINSAIDSVQPKNIHYKTLQKALENYVQTTAINHDSIKVVYYEEDTVWTSSFNNYRKACLALQKLRWSNITAEQYIFVNIPSFTLDFVQKNLFASQHRIVCGKIENQTPELNSRLWQIQLFPEWHIPFSISVKEILPMVKRDTSYLSRHNYKVYNRQGKLLSPDSVPWRRYTEDYFPLKIRQTAGYHNSLGIIVFRFNNSHAVYFHDTPAKGLFRGSFRALSHGCMRTQYPFVLAKAIMELDNDILHLPKEKLVEMGIYEEQRLKKRQYYNDTESKWAVLQNHVKEEEKYFYNVKSNIPVYIRYMTAYCDEKGELCFAPDFYGRDSLLMLHYNRMVEKNSNN
ncbi:MAG: L,D-transpeptidase family protein [Bacteroidales bacterium]|jgi:murein L,D-transpeptidase YcbB/YkuD|nr:L,D-transpeptidase family protein [Bacteroidales bacterium]